MRSKAIALAALVALVLVFIASSADSATTVLNAETIKAGLRTTTVEEKGFVDRVVGLAESGTLPPQLVESTFQWARKKPYFRFQYFKRGLIARASKLGISL